MIHALLLSLVLILPQGQRPGGKEKPFIAATRSQARRGQAKAQFDLGVMYAFGQGVPKNESEAVAWYRKAAAQGYAKAQYNLGVCCDFGRGLLKDNAEAVIWYRKAAEQGHSKAQFNLGVSYKYGQGVRRDDSEAFAWLSLAAAGGEPKAPASREEVARALAPQEMEQAQARVQQLQEAIRAAQPKPKRPGPRRSRRKPTGH